MQSCVTIWTTAIVILKPCTYTYKHSHTTIHALTFLKHLLILCFFLKDLWNKHSEIHGYMCITFTLDWHTCTMVLRERILTAWPWAATINSAFHLPLSHPSETYMSLPTLHVYIYIYISLATTCMYWLSSLEIHMHALICPFERLYLANM